MIPRATWDQLVPQISQAMAAVIVFGNLFFGWGFGDDKVRALLTLLSIVLAVITTVLYANTSTPNRQVDEMVAMAYDHGEKSGLAQAALPQQSVDPRFYKGGL